MNEVINAKVILKKEPGHHWLLKKNDVMIVKHKNKLILPVKEGSSVIEFYVSDSELFAIYTSSKTRVSIGGRDHVIKELSTRYKNITRHDIELFIQLCKPCQQKQKGCKKGIVAKPLICSELNSRCQVD